MSPVPAPLAAPGLTVTWLGHAGTTIDLDGTRLLTDPLLRPNVGALRRYGPAPAEDTWRGADAVLISHLHHDHLDLPSLQRLGPDVPLVVPAGSASLFPGFRDVREMRVGDDTRVGALLVTAVRAHHPGERARTELRGPALGYLVRGSRRIWFAGDTGPATFMRDLRGEVDLAMLPVGGWGPSLGPFHLDPRQAAGVASLVAARAAIPIHWGTLLVPGLRTVRPDLARHPGERFARWSAQVARGTEVFVLTPGVPTGMP